MNRTVLVLLAVTVLSGCTTQDSATTTPPRAFSADDESAIRTLVNEFANTWNRHDMTAMHELDTEDVEWINVVGHHWRGKTTVHKGHTVNDLEMVAQIFPRWNRMAEWFSRVRRFENA